MLNTSSICCFCMKFRFAIVVLFFAKIRVLYDSCGFFLSTTGNVWLRTVIFRCRGGFDGSLILLRWFYEINSHYSFALALICSAICFISLNISSSSSSETSIMLGKSILADISDFEAISSLTFLSMASRADCGRFSS